ncbi:hypothetical protein PSI22_00290 [Xenorhabdus sp. XENO-7]|uniref:Uncharacterized protein n=1 Tax=Xenorhabdus aichiensis TaxID=3025874 RepID=A0ABT5LXS4_9GAMM|nr:hypothetical protein [Xenorhabdus aichiensis]MDC9620102.1 hypothetical protein [Xenorhabdus aichiensis]
MIKRYRWAIVGIVIVACFFAFLSSGYLPSEKSPAQESVQWIEIKHGLIEKRLGLVGKLQSGRIETIPAPFDATWSKKDNG